MSVLDKESANNEMQRFFDNFKVDPIKLRTIDKEIEICKELIQAGMLIVTEDGHLTYKLLEPVIDDSGITKLESLTFKNKRIRVEDAQKIEEKSTKDQVKNLFTILTDCNPAFVSKITGDDLVYFQKVACFFLPVQLEI